MKRTSILTTVVTVPLFLLCAIANSLQTSPFGGRVGPTFDITKYGAKGDNATLNTQSFELAVSAVKQAGGGTVYIHDGIFITAPRVQEDGIKTTCHKVIEVGNGDFEAVYQTVWDMTAHSDKAGVEQYTQALKAVVVPKKPIRQQNNDACVLY